MFAVWLLPEKIDEEDLQKIIQNLSHKYDAPNFSPHITVFIDSKSDLDSIKKAVKNSITNISPFVIQKSKIEFSDHIFKAVYFSVKLNYQLIQINKKLSNFLYRNHVYVFNPHISLLYKILNESERKKIDHNTNIKKNCVIDRIAIVKITEKISDWKIYYVLTLGAKL